MNFIEEIEAIKADSSLSAEDKKHKIKSLKRKARRAAIKTGEHVPTHRETPAERMQAESALTYDQLVVSVTDFCTAKLQPQDPKVLGYAFSLRQAANLKVTDPTAFTKKFQSRWGYAPETFCLMPKGMDTLLFLGPIRVSQ